MQRASVALLVGCGALSAVALIWNAVLAPVAQGHGLAHFKCPPGSHTNDSRTTFGPKLMRAREQALQARSLTAGYPLQTDGRSDQPNAPK